MILGKFLSVSFFSLCLICCGNTTTVLSSVVYGGTISAIKDRDGTASSISEFHKLVKDVTVLLMLGNFIHTGYTDLDPVSHLISVQAGFMST